MQQWYYCPGCRQYIEYGQSKCQHCGCAISWGPVQQQIHNIEQEKPQSNTWKIVLGVAGGLLLSVSVAICIFSDLKPSNTAPSQNLGIQTSQASQTDQAAIYEQASLVHVDRVIDGDTIEVLIDNKKYKVRYIGIDTSEPASFGKPAGLFAEEASAKNSELVLGKTVRLEKDVSETDRYDRLLRYVYVGDLFINAELVRTGYAQVFTYPPDVKYQDLFLELQRQARESKLGLWAYSDNETVIVTSAAPIRYIGNRNSKIFHYESCSSVGDMKESNKVIFYSRDEAITQGYRPCKRCEP